MTEALRRMKTPNKNTLILKYKSVTCCLIKVPCVRIISLKLELSAEKLRNIWVVILNLSACWNELKWKQFDHWIESYFKLSFSWLCSICKVSKVDEVCGRFGVEFADKNFASVIISSTKDSCHTDSVCFLYTSSEFIVFIMTLRNGFSWLLYVISCWISSCGTKQ